MKIHCTAFSALCCVFFFFEDAVAVSGSPYGFATGVSGGGSATPAAPSSLAQLTTWLSDNVARVILIDRTWDFTGTEGTATVSGCYQSGCSPAQGGQDYIGTLSCGNSNDIATTITYDLAGQNPLKVASDKTILGVGTAGVLKGKGLVLPSGTTNVIIQNIEITNINPGHVWGGDALDLSGNLGVWVDHCTFSLIGRQFIVSHYNASQATFSNNYFDGFTTTSAVCNHEHYWNIMLIGENDLITLDKNYFYDTSGRAPKIGEDGLPTVVQATNNYWYNGQGHAFDIYEGSTVLIEGNYFQSVTTPMTNGDVSTVFDVPTSASAALCSSYIGRNCVTNTLSGSGTWPSLAGTTALSTFKNYGTHWLVNSPLAASAVPAYVVANAGTGHI